MSRVANLFRRARNERGLRIVEIARQAGYTNINKGIRRLTNIETGSNMFPRQVIYGKFIGLLGLDEFDVFQAMADDFAELVKAVPPKLVIRIIASFYTRHELPDGCTTEQAIVIAERVARERNKAVCVTLSLIRGLYISPSGKRREAYGLPISSLPFLESMRGLYPGHTFKEQLRLFRALAATKVEVGH